MGKQIANNEALSLTGDLQQVALKLHAYFCEEIKFGRIKNPVYFPDIHRLVQRKIDEDPEFRKQFGGAIRFTGSGGYPYSGELEYAFGYLWGIGKIKMDKGYICFPEFPIPYLKLLGPGR